MAITVTIGMNASIKEEEEDALPEYIKYDIPLYTPDTKSLISLLTSSSPFKNLYEKYKAAMPQLLNDALFEDASKYKEESYFIAYFSESFRTKRRDASDLDAVLLSYPSAKINSANPTASKPTPWYHSRILKGPNEFRNRVINNHKAILELCEQFVSKMKYPKLLVDMCDGFQETAKDRYLKEGAPATASEKETIIRGLYRLWLITMTYCANLAPEADSEEVDEDFARFISCYRCLGNLGYWEVKVIQVLLSYFMRELKPIFLSFREKETAVKRFFLSDEYPIALAEEMYVGHYFNAFMTNEYPHNAAKWLGQATEEKELSYRFNDLSSTIRAAALSGPLMKKQLHSRLFLCRDIRGWHTREMQESISGKELQEDIPVKRLCKMQNGDGLGCKMTNATPAVKKVAWLAVELTREESTDSDMWAVVWDDWRLQEWGYFFPVFEEKALRRPSHFRRLSSVFKMRTSISR
ncbi:hypothetical protein H072_8485 [Dactylellina haptotyla CBS 200.50]|uniref:Uncharacterized protein n=1 Tax=Dactylellina haptotyla (strain CBS 200.50) TaxID=1284197 RepID=S8BRG8_DACHA|nr:hypothetical protein H072_8485 [Dactylellina haptotyla CBS 200.50]